MNYHIVHYAGPSGVLTYAYHDATGNPDTFPSRWEALLPDVGETLPIHHLTASGIIRIPLEDVAPPTTGIHMVQHHFWGGEKGSVYSLGEWTEAPKTDAIEIGQQWMHDRLGENTIITVLDVYTTKKNKTKVRYATTQKDRRTLGYYEFTSFLSSIKAVLVSKEEVPSFNLLHGQVYVSEGHPDIVVTSNQHQLFARHMPPAPGGLLWDCSSYKALVAYLTEHGYVLDESKSSSS